MRVLILILLSAAFCFPLNSSAAPLKACLKTETGKVVIKRRCKAAKGQQEINAETLQGLGATQIGPTGPKGDKGNKGDKGEAGIQGPAGPLLEELPSGHTLRGRYALGGLSTGPAVAASAAVSFPLLVSDVFKSTGPGVNCPGTVASPEANPGFLCIYPGLSTNVNVGEGLSLNAVGFVFSRFSLGAGPFSERGSWAVTSP